MTYLVLAYAVTALMGAVAVVGLWRWRHLERPGRWIVASITIHFVTAIVARALILSGQSPRQFGEVPSLLANTAALIGFAFWQPRAGQRRLLWLGIGGYLALWLAAQAVQGLEAQYSYLTSPLHALALCAAAGFTMVNRVRVSPDRWTGQLWFWVCTALMLDYGTEVVLMPLTMNVASARRDLVEAAFYCHLGTGVIGYGMISWAIWRLAAPLRLRPGLTLGEVNEW